MSAPETAWLPAGLIIDQHLIQQLHRRNHDERCSLADFRATLSFLPPNELQVVLCQLFDERREGDVAFGDNATMAATLISYCLTTADVQDLYAVHEDARKVSIEDFSFCLAEAGSEDFIDFVKFAAKHPLDFKSPRNWRAVKKAYMILSARGLYKARKPLGRHENWTINSTTLAKRSDVQDFADFTRSRLLKPCRDARYGAYMKLVFEFALSVGLDLVDAIGAMQDADARRSLAQFCHNIRNNASLKGSYQAEWTKRAGSVVTLNRVRRISKARPGTRRLPARTSMTPQDSSEMVHNDLSFPQPPIDSGSTTPGISGNDIKHMAALQIAAIAQPTHTDDRSEAVTSLPDERPFSSSRSWSCLVPITPTGPRHLPAGEVTTRSSQPTLPAKRREKALGAVASNKTCALDSTAVCKRKTRTMRSQAKIDFEVSSITASSLDEGDIDKSSASIASSPASCSEDASSGIVDSGSEDGSTSDNDSFSSSAGSSSSEESGRARSQTPVPSIDSTYASAAGDFTQITKTTIDSRDTPSIHNIEIGRGNAFDLTDIGGFVEVPGLLGFEHYKSEPATESANAAQTPERKRKQTGVGSKHFVTPVKNAELPKKLGRVQAGTSSIPVPPLTCPVFGLVQEELACKPFELLLAVVFLNKTNGKYAIPAFRNIVSRYPTPKHLAEANETDVVALIHHLGLQNQRAKKLVQIAKVWETDPPTRNRRYRTQDYPFKGAHREITKYEVLTDPDPRPGALEIGHIPGLGAYAYDSWRIFCRDTLRDVADGWNGEGARAGFEPEWKRVVPFDKELRAFLRWMWLKEGWWWNPRTGEKEVASREVVRAVKKGGFTFEEWDDRHAREETE